MYTLPACLRMWRVRLAKLYAGMSPGFFISVRPSVCHASTLCLNKKAVLPQGNRAMPQVFFSVEVRQQHSLQV